MLSVPELKGPIMEMLTNITSDKFDGVLAFDMLQGEPLTIPWKYSLYKDDTHKLDQHFHPGIRFRFDLRNSGPTIFQRMAISTLKKYDYDESDRILGQELHDTFTVASDVDNGEQQKDIITHRVGNWSVYAYPSNTVARNLIATIGDLDKVEDLNDLIAEDPARTEQLQAIIELRKSGEQETPSEFADEFVRLAYTLDVEVLEDNLNGQLLPKENFYEMVLLSLLNRDTRVDRLIDAMLAN